MPNTYPKDSPRKGKPTERMVAAAVSAGARHSVKPPKGFDQDFDVCKAFLDHYLSMPTPKAIAFAQTIASEKGIELPAAVLVNGKELSAWIDENRQPAGQ